MTNREFCAEVAKRWQLSSKETELLDQLALGRTNLEAAERLGKSEKTVEVQVTKVLKKAGIAWRGRPVLLAKLLEAALVRMTRLQAYVTRLQRRRA